MFAPSDVADRRFKAALWISLAIHLSPFVILPFMGLFKGPPKPVRRAYFFEMVEPPSRPRSAVRTAAPPVAQPKKAAAAPAPKKAAPQKTAVPSSKKTAATSTAAVPASEPPVPEAAAADNAAEGTLDNEMTIGKPGFPFRFYEQQIMAAVERNWQPPQELLGAENQLVVVVKFDVQKDGSVTGLSIAESSWNNILDKLALRAVEKARIPPIPGADQSLSITYRLVLKRG